MNKQQLASKIWESANKMRSKIEANEYKDYILGFIFYKFLSDKEVGYLMNQHWSESELVELTESDTETVQSCQNNLGYFISYDNLFSTWLCKDKKKAFDVSNVTDALSAFNRLISKSHEKVFTKIFDTLSTGLNKLGETSGARTKAISGLLQLIKEIPMDGKQDYDVLGFIYEYLISNFAANAGKKAGEFYTPHEVSLLMSEIVANHLKDKEEIKIYDPTSGSGSLLINIGHSVAKHITNENKIKYYAQELKENTYNLTRMNLVMRGILPDNIVTRNGDTLENDWPYFDENDSARTYNPLYVDAVVSNPPYSQQWDSSNKELDACYSRYGLAPKSKADYAFLLHGLYHIKPDGIMTIVLPHGVLFRGGEEEAIRRNLIENNNIDTIIGLPANIFFGTGIPTIIMVLKQKRKNTDILIIDASKHFTKEGKNNKLRASDIKRIADTVIERKSIEKYSRVVTREEIRNNGYNLNIPRYVDSSEKSESWDIYSTMFGGIPIEEINELEKYWQAFPKLKKELFKTRDDKHFDLKVSDVKSAILANDNIKLFESAFTSSFQNFDEFLSTELIVNMMTLNIAQEEADISKEMFKRFNSIPLLDKYSAYQLLDDEWIKISTDLEIIQTEGFSATKEVFPNYITKKKGNEEEQVQDGWVGYVLPFNLVQVKMLPNEVAELRQKEERLAEVTAIYDELIEGLSEDDKQNLLNDTNDAFVAKTIKSELNLILSSIHTIQTDLLNEYLLLRKKGEKVDFIAKHSTLFDSSMQKNKDNTYSVSIIKQRIALIKEEIEFESGSYEETVYRVNSLMTEEKELKQIIKVLNEQLIEKTVSIINNLSDEEVIILLKQKWIVPIVNALHNLPSICVESLISHVISLAEKYSVTYIDVEKELAAAEASLSSMIEELTCDEFDMKGLQEIKSLFGGLKND